MGIAKGEKMQKNTIRSPSGTDIQKALMEECLKVSPYVKMESGCATRFDLVMYLPKPMNFIANAPISYHCWHKYRRLYCKKIWRDIIRDYLIPDKEREERIEQYKKDNPNREWHARYEIPRFRYKDKEYMEESSFWQSNAKKDIALCNQPNCDWWKKQQDEANEAKKIYGFMNGLHAFEIKSDKDNHDLLIHQIPNMISIADYVWLVLGENQTIPAWLPPYISIMRYNNAEKTFKIEYVNEINITQPPIYKHVFDNQGYKIENNEIYAFARLMRNWRINSMFHFMFEGQTAIDMQKDIKMLLKFLKRTERNKTREANNK